MYSLECDSFKTVKSTLRYIIPIILVALAAIGGSDRADSTVLGSEVGVSTIFSEVETHYFDASASHLDPHLPRQISSANVFRLQNAAKRTAGVQRNNFGFVKAGKVVNAGVRNVAHKESLNLQHFLVKPAYRLISLGKLII